MTIVLIIAAGVIALGVAARYAFKKLDSILNSIMRRG